MLERTRYTKGEQTALNMNVDKIVRTEKRYNYLDNVQASLSEFGLTLSDVKTYKQVGRSSDGKADTIFKHNFGKGL